MLMMGGYWAYVWPAYLVVLGGLAWLMLKSIKATKKMEWNIKQREKH